MCMIGSELRKPVMNVRRGKPIVAFRAWRLTRGGNLRSTSQNFRWNKNGVTTAGIAPDKAKKMSYFNTWGIRQCSTIENNDGLWAFKTPTAVDRQFGRYGYKVGVVLLWGRVVEHRNGYRAEHARIWQ